MSRTHVTARIQGEVEITNQYDILLFCRVREVGVLACLSKEWAQAVNDPHLWKNINSRDFVGRFADPMIIDDSMQRILYRWNAVCFLLKHLTHVIVGIHQSILKHNCDFDEAAWVNLETSVKMIESDQSARWTPLFYQCCRGQGIAGGEKRAEKVVRSTLEQLRATREIKVRTRAQVLGLVPEGESVRRRIWAVLCGGLPLNEEDRTLAWKNKAVEWTPRPLNDIQSLSVFDSDNPTVLSSELYPVLASSTLTDEPPQVFSEMAVRRHKLT
jgi:hypothetical protein